MTIRLAAFSAQMPEELAWFALPAVAIAAGYLFHLVVFAVARRLAAATAWSSDDVLVARLCRPSRLLLPMLALQLAEPALGLPLHVQVLLPRVVALVVAGGLTWLLFALIDAMSEIALARFPVDVADNLEARRLYTQIDVFRRTAKMFIGVVGASIALMTIPAVRQLGAGLLASAGVVGLVLGIAARPAVTNVIAGMQLALTQPIRIDDVLIVEGEWGRVEEITATYVVIRIWDERRLVVPLSYFLENPFQNWTRTSSSILGTVFLYLDYTVPVQVVREEAERLIRAAPQFDGRVAQLVVTNTDAQVVELRALMSAANSGDAWDLRCHVREQLLEYVQKRYPECLPRMRAQAELHGDTRHA